MVKNNNIELKNKTLDIQISSKDIDIAKGMHFGKLDLEHQMARSNSPENVFGFKLANGDVSFGDFGFNPEAFAAMFDPSVDFASLQPDAVNNPDSRNFSRTSIKYELPLYTGGIISNYQKITKKVNSIRTLQKDKLENEKIFELKKSFYSFKLLNESEENLNNVLSNIKGLSKIVAEMNSIGYAKKVDKLEVRSRQLMIENFLNEIDNNKKLLLSFISFLTQQKITDIEIPHKLIVSTDFIDVEQTHDVRMAKIGTEINDKMLAVSKASWLPKVGGFAEVRDTDSDFLPDFKDSKYSIGVGVQMNLFNGFSDQKKIEKAKLELLKSKNNLALARQGTSLKLNQLITELKTLLLNEQSQQSQIDLVKEIENNYRERYKEQLVGINELLVKNSILIQNILKLQSIQTNAQVKMLEIQKLTEGN